VGATCHFSELYIWSGFSSLRGILACSGLDIQIPEMGVVSSQYQPAPNLSLRIAAVVLATTNRFVVGHSSIA
jgi:hypothetical protein